MMFFSLNDEHDFYLNIERHEKHESFLQQRIARMTLVTTDYTDFTDDSYNNELHE